MTAATSIIIRNVDRLLQAFKNEKVREIKQNFMNDSIVVVLLKVICYLLDRKNEDEVL